MLVEREELESFVEMTRRRGAEATRIAVELPVLASGGTGRQGKGAPADGPDAGAWNSLEAGPGEMIQIVDDGAFDEWIPDAGEETHPRPRRERSGFGNLAKQLGIKPTKADRLYYRQLKTSCDLYDWTWKYPKAAEVHQVSTERLQRHLNGTHFTEKLKKLPLWIVTLHRRGLYPALYVKPRKVPGNAPPVWFVRFDADAHQGETDAEAALRWFDDTYCREMLYHEASQRGRSAYAFVPLAPYEWSIRDAADHGAEPIYPSTRHIEGLRLTLQRAMQTIWKHVGFRSTIEVCGSPNQIQGRHGERMVAKRGNMVKLPRVPQDDDIEKLGAARLPMSVVERIIDDAKAIGEGRQPSFSSRGACRYARSRPTVGAASAERRIESKSLHPRSRALRKPRRVEDTGDVFLNRLRCMSLAKNAFLARHDATSVTTRERDQIRELANHLYEDNGLARDARDADRERAWNDSLAWMLRTHDPDAVAIHGLWWAEAEMARAAEIDGSTMSNARLRALNHDPRLKKVRLKIHRRHFQVAICMVAKDVQVNNGEVPARALLRTFEHERLAANGSLVSIVMEELKRRGLFRCVDGEFGKGKCRRWACAPIVYTLPFLRHLRPRATGEEPAEIRSKVRKRGARGGANPQPQDAHEGDDSLTHKYYVAPTPKRKSFSQSKMIRLHVSRPEAALIAPERRPAA